MSTSLTSVVDVLETLKNKETVFVSDDIPAKYAKLGVIQASIQIDRDWSLVDSTDEATGEVTTVISEDLSSKELYLCGLNAYRNYAIQRHDEATDKATNFKTINFAVHGLTEKAKEAMRVVWWCDTEIKRVLRFLSPPLGNSIQMRGD